MSQKISDMTLADYCNVGPQGGFVYIDGGAFRSVATELRDARAALVSAQEDAARWRALMASDRIRIMGSAGFHKVGDDWVPKPDAPLHMGVELWDQHPDQHPSAEYPQERCRNQLVAYVDSIREAKAKKDVP